MAGCLSSSVGEALVPCVTSQRVFLKKKKTFIDPTVGIKFSISAILCILCIILSCEGFVLASSSSHSPPPTASGPGRPAAGAALARTCFSSRAGPSIPTLHPRSGKPGSAVWHLLAVHKLAQEGILCRKGRHGLPAPPPPPQQHYRD